jgi:hypothetical protein
MERDRCAPLPGAWAAPVVLAIVAALAPAGTLPGPTGEGTPASRSPRPTPAVAATAIGRVVDASMPASSMRSCSRPTQGWPCVRPVASGSLAPADLVLG